MFSLSPADRVIARPRIVSSPNSNTREIQTDIVILRVTGFDIDSEERFNLGVESLITSSEFEFTNSTQFSDEEFEIMLMSEAAMQSVNASNDECTYVYLARDEDHEKYVNSTDSEDSLRKLHIGITNDMVNTARDIAVDSGTSLGDDHSDFAREIFGSHNDVFTFDDYPGIIIMGI